MKSIINQIKKCINTKLNHQQQQPSNIHASQETFETVLKRINAIDLSTLPDSAFKLITHQFRMAIMSGRHCDSILVEAFALVKEAIKRILRITPYDTQIMAGLALYEGRIAQMQTGEGKTLAAVMPAYLRALEGKGVHILTFNDYLAKRDALWMGPVFSFLGLTVGSVQEGMDSGHRRHAYQCDITYVTAREAGFDYLRDFMCSEKDDFVHRPFHFAIVDEADSIMIDEARIPLVIAGKYGADEEAALSKIYAIAGQLKLGRHFEVDSNAKDIFLTDEGIGLAERLFHHGNLYDASNAENLSSLYVSLYVQHLLKRDKEYIIKNGKVLLIDEFTGRIAENRMFPNRIQTAIEIKEGILGEGKGAILGSIAMQYFLMLYPLLAGMTGTATNTCLIDTTVTIGVKKKLGSPLASMQPCSEFQSFYHKEVLEIPTYKPAIRIDHPDRVFTSNEAKNKALVEEIVKVHQTGQPILIGTQSIEESEALAEKLKGQGVALSVLNAKNDEMEADIIASAGSKGAVTVSTNMAGRGVDIKLGGKNEASRNEVVALGGLYIIGTGRHESVRIDNQLRGRAGRQGDPGESRFFVSLEDAIFQRFQLTEGFMERYCPNGYSGELHDAHLIKEIARCQRMVEGYNSDMRHQLSRYTFIIEQQRRLLFKKRMDMIHGRIQPELLQKKEPELFRTLNERHGETAVRQAEKQLTLYLINKGWMEYLDYMSYIKESIHLVVLGGQSLVDAFNKKAIAAFDDMQKDIEGDLVKLIQTIDITPDGVNMAKAGLMGPASTWTYLLNESSDQFSRIPQMIKAVSKAFTGTLFTFRGLYRKLVYRRTQKSI